MGRLKQDFERTLHLINRGYEVRYLDAVEAFTTGEEGLSGLFRQRVRWEDGFLRRHLQFKTIVRHPPHPSLLYEFLFNWVAVIGLHPLKLLALPILLMNPLSLLVFYLAYVGIDAASLWRVRKEKIHYSLITPLYGLFLLFPRTVGFAKGIYDEVKKIPKGMS